MKITCNIIEDILPLYVDGVVSEDSRRLVEEHLEGCEECRYSLAEMQEEWISDDLGQKAATYGEEEKKSLKKIKSRIRKQRILTAVIAALFVCVAVFCIDEYYNFHGTYIPYEETGFYVENDKLYTTKSAEGRLMVVYSPDQTVEFLYEMETWYAKRKFPNTGERKLWQDFLEIDTGESEDKGTSTMETIQRVYYLSEDQIKKCHALWDIGDSEQEEKALKEIEKKSILIWERK